MRTSVIIFLLVFSCVGSSVHSMDEIRVVPGQSEKDTRHNYPNRILKAALDATIETDGPYTLAYAPGRMTRKRALDELKAGVLINVQEAPTQEEWENTLIPIRIPVRKGLLGYRLFLVKKGNLKKFREVKTIEELKVLKAGLGAQWSTTIVMKGLGFPVVLGSKYEGLFTMLNENRFDYFPRGISEIYEEFESRKVQYPDMRIEPTKVLYFTTPTYFFVSPRYPQLADRIKRGLLAIIENGVLDTEFYVEYGDYIKKSKLESRIILKVENKLLSKETPLGQSKFWYTP